MHHKNIKKIIGRRGALLVLALILFSLLLIGSVSADNLADPPGSDFAKYWKSYVGNIWNVIARWDDSGTSNANAGDIYGWYNHTSDADIAMWELVFCASDIAPEVLTVSSSASGGVNSVYVTTITMTALKSEFNETEFLYETSWYIQPLTINTPYRVYLIDDAGAKYYLPNGNNQWTDAPPRIGGGGSGFVAFYSPRIFNKAVLEYNESAVTKHYPNEGGLTIVEKS